MRALTICQPYAHLILLPETDPRHKRVENRTWAPNYRGPLLIHAGKNRNWLKYAEDSFPIEEMAFGAIVGVADLVDVVCTTEVREAMRKYPWLGTHRHAEAGLTWWILQNVRPFPRPIPWRGVQRLFDVPDEAVAEVLK